MEDAPLRSATAALFERYQAIAEANASLTDTDQDDPAGPAYVVEFCRLGIARIDELPLDKLSRWLGFVQGCLAARGLISVDEERDFSRPLFHAAYSAQHIQIPPTLAVASGRNQSETRTGEFSPATPSDDENSRSGK